MTSICRAARCVGRSLWSLLVAENFGISLAALALARVVACAHLAVAPLSHWLLLPPPPPPLLLLLLLVA